MPHLPLPVLPLLLLLLLTPRTVVGVANSLADCLAFAKLNHLMGDGEDPTHVMIVRTAAGGYNSGRTYYLKAESEDVAGGS